METLSYEAVFQAFEPYLHGDLNASDKLPEIDQCVIQDLIQYSIDILKNTSTVVNVPAPCIIIGDLHGNISDLINILRKFNDYTSCSFLFLGDYVDRGMNSIEVITLLLAMMCKFPNNFFLLRGNHEFANVNRQYGFREEIQIVYRSQELWENFQDAFDWLPLAAIVNNQIFCVHGGLSPSLHKIETINAIQRPIRKYENSLISDLVWSDPNDKIQDFSENHRGSGVFYGESAVKTFLVENKLKLLIRAHQCMADGFCTFASNTGVTIFSSSEYARLIHNKCGVMKILPRGKIEIYSFSHDNYDILEPKYTMVIVKAGIGMRRLIVRPQNSCPNISNNQLLIKRPPPKKPMISQKENRRPRAQNLSKNTTVKSSEPKLQENQKSL